MSDTEAEIAEQMGSDDEDAQLEEEESQADDTQADGEPELATEAQPPRSQKEIEDLQAKLHREGERHAKRVAEIMGEDFALLVPSPVDWTPGFIFNVPEMLPFPEQVAAFDALIGRAGGSDFRDAEDAERCDKCDGLGDVLTGSRKQGQETKPCSACTGTGWKTKLRVVEQPAFNSGTAAAGSATVISPDVYQVKDSWGRPSGHPHFGIDPVSITA